MCVGAQITVSSQSPTVKLQCSYQREMWNKRKEWSSLPGGDEGQSVASGTAGSFVIRLEVDDATTLRLHRDVLFLQSLIYWIAVLSTLSLCLPG